MRKFKDLTKSEKGMVITLVLLLLAIFLNWGRVSKQVVQGFETFFSVPDTTESISK